MAARRSQRRPKRRARRSSLSRPRLPVLDQRQRDLVGLGLVALGAFLFFVFYLRGDGGAVGRAIADGLVFLLGLVAYLVPVGLVLGGVLVVLRPMLPAVRPFRTGALLLAAGLMLGLAAQTFGLGPSAPPRGGGFFDPAFFRHHGGAVGEGLYWVARTLFQQVGADIAVVFLVLSGALLLTGASVAGIVRATGGGVTATTRRVRRSTAELASAVTARMPSGPARASGADRTAARGSATAEAFSWPDPGPLERDERRGEDRLAVATASYEDDAADGEARGAPAPEPPAEPVVRATHVEAPPLDGEERYPDLFAGAETRTRPAAEAEDEELHDGDPGDGAPDAEVWGAGEEVPDGESPEPPAPDAGPRLEAGAENPERSPADAPPAGRPSTPASDPGPHDLTPQGRLRSSVTQADDFVYRVAPASFLRRSSGAARPDTKAEARLGAQLVEALGHFGVDAQVVGTVSGPHVTRYELRLAPGTKMSKAAQLKDDIAYALAATDVRILAPIPGKQAVGVEVPNAVRRIVHLGDVFQESPKGWSPLTVWLGKDIAGKAIGTDLAKQPHVLVAGTTGSGKSGCVNAMLSSILLRATPNEVKLVLVDPKQVELNHYESVPHLLTPVVTSPRLAANVLANLIKEMEERYSIMSLARTRNLVELNRHREERGERPLPYILCVIDELADLMMVAPSDVEDAIIRLAQKSRAVGIHLLLATQRPSADIITGMIKANVPARIAFAVSSQTDSRVILDQNGAESLLGQGDMLFRPASESRPARIQGAFIAEEEIERITDHWRRQGEPELQEELLEAVEDGGDDDGAGDFDPDQDHMLGEAIATVVQMGTASTSMLQRRLRVGYTRAGRLIDMMERRGVISGYEGSKARQVLISEADVPRIVAALDEPIGAGADDGR